MRGRNRLRIQQRPTRKPAALSRRGDAVVGTLGDQPSLGVRNGAEDTDHLRRQGRLPDPSLLRDVSPLGWKHIVLTGDYDWNSGAAERTNVRPLNLYPAKLRA